MSANRRSPLLPAMFCRLNRTSSSLLASANQRGLTVTGCRCPVHFWCLNRGFSSLLASANKLGLPLNGCRHPVTFCHLESASLHLVGVNQSAEPASSSNVFAFESHLSLHAGVGQSGELASSSNILAFQSCLLLLFGIGQSAGSAD